MTNTDTTITIPNGVSIVKATITCADDDFNKYYVMGSSKYIKVTPGQDYTLTLSNDGHNLNIGRRGQTSANIENTWNSTWYDIVKYYNFCYEVSYSASINEQTPDIEDLL